ncbi:hypothetical protein IAU60_005535 [Kwoniella sp. DSM 27419]
MPRRIKRNQARTRLLLLFYLSIYTTATARNTVPNPRPLTLGTQTPTIVDTAWSNRETAPAVSEYPETQLVYLPIATAAAPASMPSPLAPSPSLHPLAVVLILCVILGFCSTLLTLPFNLSGMSSSSSSKPTSSSSAPKPSSSSSSRPSGSSSSSSPSSASSSRPSGSSSSSSKDAPKPPAPQPVPTISANAWMSFFLFCCLVLIFLQGPLGLTGASLVPTLPALGAGWWNPASGLVSPTPALVPAQRAGWSTLGGMPGCAGVMAGMVPWCSIPSGYELPHPPHQPQIQIQQVYNPAPPAYTYEHPRGVAGSPQMGGQGHFATPGGGGGSSWYSSRDEGSPPVRYYPAGSQRYPGRSVQYQRPGLQIQVQDGRAQQQGTSRPFAYWVFADTTRAAHLYPLATYTCPYHAYHHLPQTYNTFAPAYTWQYPGYTTGPYQWPNPTPWYGLYLPTVFAHAYSLRIPDEYEPRAQINPGDGSGSVIMQPQGMRPHHPQMHAASVATVPVLPAGPPVTAPPAAVASLANLENAFYPLLVAAIALLVVFDYAS